MHSSPASNRSASIQFSTEVHTLDSGSASNKIISASGSLGSLLSDEKASLLPVPLQTSQIQAVQSSIAQGLSSPDKCAEVQEKVIKESERFTADQVHKMLEIDMAISPPLDARTFNSFMPSLALAAASIPTEDRPALLDATLQLFGETVDSARAVNLRNAVYAFPVDKPGGGKWTWMDFSDPMNDPLDEKKVYDL